MTLPPSSIPYHSKFLLVLLSFFSTLTFGQLLLGGEKNDKGVDLCKVGSDFFLLGNTRNTTDGNEDMVYYILDDEQNIIHQNLISWPNYDFAAKCIPSKDGNVIVTGFSWSAPGPGWRNDVVVLKISMTGEVLWTSYFGGRKDDFVFDVFEAKDEGILVAGMDREIGSLGAMTLFKLDKDGVEEWNKSFYTSDNNIAYAITQSEDSSIYLAGVKNGFIGKNVRSFEYGGSEPTKIQLLKLDRYGNEIWHKFYGGSGYEFVKDIKFHDGFIYMLGSSQNGTSGSFDVSLYKLNQDGDVIWNKKFGGPKFEYGNSLAIDASGLLNVLGITGSFSGDLTTDVYFASIDTDGDLVVESYADKGLSDYGESIIAQEDGNFAFIGTSVVESEGVQDKQILFSFFNGMGDVVAAEEFEEKETSAPNLTVFYNRQNGSLDLRFNANYDYEGKAFTFYNSEGRIITEKTIQSISESINLPSDLGTGVFIYNVNNQLTGKIIIN